MKIAIGHSNMENSELSGRLCAEKAMDQGNGEAPNLVLAFCSGKIAAPDFYRGLRSVIPASTPIVGGSAIGIITNKVLSYGEHACAVAVIQSGLLNCAVETAGNLNLDEYRAGQELGEKIPRAFAPGLMLLFYDSLKHCPTATTPPVLNASPPLLRGIEDSAPAAVPIVGAGLFSSKAFDPTYQFCGFSVEQQSAVGVLLSGEFSSHTCIIHGCAPKDGLYHRITRMSGNVVNEVDGRPIVDFITEACGSSEWKKQRPVRFLGIGINHGDRWGAFDEDSYVNRLIIGTLPDDSGIVMFEPDLEVGTEIQFMLRDGLRMVASARERSRHLIEQILAQGKTPCFGLYIDCAGRTADESYTLSEEAAEVQTAFNDHRIPLLGFYSGVEIAPLLGKNRGLDWTGVLWIAAK